MALKPRHSLKLVLHTSCQNVTFPKQSVVLKLRLRAQGENITNSCSSESNSTIKKKLTFYTAFSYTGFLIPFQMQLSQTISGGLSLSAAAAGCRTINLSDNSIDEMVLMPGRHYRCHENPSKNCFCIINFLLSHVLVLWNISWFMAFCPTFEGVPLQDIQQLCFCLRHLKNALFSTLYIAISIQPDMSIIGLIHAASAVFLAVLQPVALGYTHLFTCSPAKPTSRKKSYTSAILRQSKENNMAHNNSSKAHYYLCMDKLWMPLTLQITFTQIVPV